MCLSSGHGVEVSQCVSVKVSTSLAIPDAGGKKRLGASGPFPIRRGLFHRSSAPGMGCLTQADLGPPLTFGVMVSGFYCTICRLDSEVNLQGSKMHILYFLAGLEYKCSINAQ